MFSRLITKYGLATHLALLVSLPLALAPFVAESMLAIVVFWLTGIALLWIFAEPSMRAGEHLTLARMRVRRSVLRDPLAWFFLVALVYSLVRWINSGISLSYNPEVSQWAVKNATWPGLPSSVGDTAFLPFAVVGGVVVLVLGLRHAVGLTARISFGVTSSFFVGVGGIASSICASMGLEPFSQMLSVDFMKGPFWGLYYGAWLVVAITSGVQAEARKWGAARIPFCLAVAGLSSGLVLFSPALFAVAVFAMTVVFSLFCFVWLGRACSKGAVARSFFLALIGFSIPFFFLWVLVPESVRVFKFQSLDTAFALSENYTQVSDTLSRIAREMWMKSPWSGVGLGAFGLHLPFFAEKADWTVLIAEAKSAFNGYWTILAERGIMGCILLAIGLGMMLFFWGQRLVGAIIYLRTNDDADNFIFACPPVVWAALFSLIPIFVVAVFIPVFTLAPVLFAVVVPLALATASFPKKPTAKTGTTQKEC